MFEGMLADFGITVNRFPGVAGDGLLAPASTSTYCPRAPADRQTQLISIQSHYYTIISWQAVSITNFHPAITILFRVDMLIMHG